MGISLALFEFLYVSTVGTIFHFIYDLSGHMFIFALFGAVNESPWEHEKMIVLPWYTWFLIKIFYYKINVTPLEMFLPIFGYIMFINICYYSYTAISKRHLIWIDIPSFYVGIYLGMLMSGLSTHNPLYDWYLGIIGNILLIFITLKNTYYPSKFIIFCDPDIQMYGMEAHKLRCMLKSKDDDKKKSG